MKYPTSKLLRERAGWAAQFLFCMACGSIGTETHEIVRRSQAGSKRWAHTANYLRLCSSCHAERFANVTLAPYAAQLALKRLKDPEHYDLEMFYEIRGRASSCVTPEEVELAYRTLVMVGA